MPYTPAMNDPDSLTRFPYASQRSAVVASEAMVATSQPLAAQAGLGVLADGGSAVDAAIATAAALTVVEPCSNGLGGDAFAIVWDGERLHGLNGSGRWPLSSSAEQLRKAGADQVSLYGWAPVTVPGAVDSWDQLHQRFGKLPIDRLLAPAIKYAEKGFPISPVVSMMWQRAYSKYSQLGIAELSDWFDVFSGSSDPGRAPRAGEMWATPGHARGLRSMAEHGLRDFYEGEIAAAIADHASATGGMISADDLADHHGEWVDPISVSYRDHDVWEIPPNGQGIAALMALGISGETAAGELPHLSEEGWHLNIEAMKLAFSDSDAFVADPEHADVPVEQLLSPKYLASRAALIDDRAGSPATGDPQSGGTVYLATADKDAMMVSFIQSNYHGFGSGVVVPSHGIALQNRGAGFTLEPGHPNVAAPGKRPRHTIIPGFLTRNGQPVGPFGVMGGEMQPQGHLQVVAAMIDHGCNPQAALDAPRWQVGRDHTVRVEQEVPTEIVEGLKRRGHTVRVESDRTSFGRGQIIQRSPEGVYIAGSEPRADGAAIGF